MILWIQNWGLALVPLLIGVMLENHCIAGTVVIDGRGIHALRLHACRCYRFLRRIRGAVDRLRAACCAVKNARKGYGLEKPNDELQTNSTTKTQIP